MGVFSCHYFSSLLRLLIVLFNITEYIYIYIWREREREKERERKRERAREWSTDCFVVLQLFSVTRYARAFKLWSKPGWLYISRISYYRHSHRKRRNFCIYIFTYTLSAIGVLSSWEELCIYVYVAASNSPVECSIYWGITIYISQQEFI